jgi:ectoine hydroxylase-related dioxygenase (phytanoyl-CoA dioxygenase family)
MEKGDTVFFHPLLLHGSEPNRTKVKSLMQFFFNCKVYSRESERQFLVITLIVTVILLM